MLLEDMECILPPDWQPMDLIHEKYRIVNIAPNTQEFDLVMEKMTGNYHNRIQGVFKVQNPFLFTKFRLKAHDYSKRGPYETKWLFHDTARENCESIAMYNFDWRYGERFKFGPGVYFSISPYLANKHSSKQNRLLRTMFLAEVLIQNVQVTDGDLFLPDFGYDTVLCHKNETFVKYFDCEYYPQYFVDYVSIQ